MCLMSYLYDAQLFEHSRCMTFMSLLVRSHTECHIDTAEELGHLRQLMLSAKLLKGHRPLIDWSQ